MARLLTVRVKGSSGLDDDQRLLDSLESSTGIRWRLESVPDEGHLSADFVEIVLAAVLGRTTELVYSDVMKKVHKTVEEWRDRYLDKPDYEISEQTVADPEDGDDGNSGNSSASAGGGPDSPRPEA